MDDIPVGVGLLIGVLPNILHVELSSNSLEAEEDMLVLACKLIEKSSQKEFHGKIYIEQKLPVINKNATIAVRFSLIFETQDTLQQFVKFVKNNLIQFM